MYGSNAYVRPYNNNLVQQNIYDQIDNEINNLQQMKDKMKNQMQQPAINQTFQLAPTNNHTIRYVNTIDDVNKEVIYYDTPFFSKDMSVLWIKNAKGDIKTYELNEIIPKDEKDIQIEFLQSQIEELKGMIKNDANVTNVDAEQDTEDTTGDDEANGTATQKSKSSSIQRVPTSKTK